MLVESNSTHIVFQGKGGVGKSYVAYLLATIAYNENCSTHLVDTDYINPCFSLCFKDLQSNVFEIMAGKEALGFLVSKEFFTKDISIVDISNIDFGKFLKTYYVKNKFVLEKMHKIRGRAIVYHLPVSELFGNGSIEPIEEFFKYIKNDYNAYYIWIFGNGEYTKKAVERVHKIHKSIVPIWIPFNHPLNIAMYECYVNRLLITIQENGNSFKELAYTGVYNLQNFTNIEKIALQR